MGDAWLRVVSSDNNATTLEVVTEASRTLPAGDPAYRQPSNDLPTAATKPLPYLRTGAKYLRLTQNADGTSKITTYDARKRFLASDWSQVQTDTSRQLFSAVYDACENAGITVNRAAAQPVVELSPKIAGRAILTAGAVATGAVVMGLSTLFSLVAGNIAVGLAIDAAIAGGFAGYFIQRKRKKNHALETAATARLAQRESSVGKLKKLEYEVRAAESRGASAPSLARVHRATTALLEQLIDLGEGGAGMNAVRERFERRYGWQVANIEEDLRCVLGADDMEAIERAAASASDALSHMSAYVESEKTQVANAHADALDARAAGIKNLAELDGVKR